MRMLVMMMITLTALTMPNISLSLEIGQCRSALGMQTDDIPDEAISVSSSIDPANYGAVSARIRKEINGGAWCPSLAISRDVYEFLQIDLGELKVLTLVETQGRFSNGQGQEYVEQYKLEYQREENKAWKSFRNIRGQEILQGNSNTYLAELKELDPPIIAKKIRFVPYSLHPKQVCLRVELYGCTWKDGTLSYDMPQGEKRSDMELNDDTYDGDRKNGYLFDGLGQLTDGELGGDTLRQDPKSSRVKGYEWVGWKNESLAGSNHFKSQLSTSIKELSIRNSQPLVELLFRFDRVRNFSAAFIHCFNNARDIRVFRSATFVFVLDRFCRSKGSVTSGSHHVEVKNGDGYNLDGAIPGFPGTFQSPLVFRPSRDLANDQRKLVAVPLENRIGDCVILKLEFDSRWIVISEVQFRSDYANETMVSQLLSLKTPADNVQDSVHDPTDADKLPDNLKTHTAIPSSTTGLTEEHVGAVVGSLCTTTLLLLIMGLVCFVRRRGRNKYVHRVMKCETSIPPLGASGTVADHTGGDGVRCFGDPIYPVAPASADCPNKTSANGSSFDAQNDFLSSAYSHHSAPSKDFFRASGSATAAKGRRLPEPPTSSTVKSHAQSSHLQAVHRQQQQQQQQQRFPVTLRASLMKKFSQNQSNESSTSAAGDNMATGSLRLPPDESLFAATQSSSDYSTIVSGSTSHLYSHPPQNHYAVLDVNWPTSPSCTANYSTVANPGTIHPELSRRRLKFIEKLGEGSFGEVFVCEILQGSLVFSCSENGRKHSILGLVKTFPMKKDPMNRLNFEAEVQKSSSLNDSNLVRLVGVVSSEDPWLVVTEYTRHGDLHRFLNKHALEGSPTTHDSRRQDCLTYGSLIFMASQIASGMKYMEQLNIVHGDLAARNCLVDDGLQMKISDLETCKTGAYVRDYCPVSGRAEPLPIRWMAWEALILSRYSTKSDVWSFGVTMWEILTMAEEPPLSALDDEEVIENMECLAKREDPPVAEGSGSGSSGSFGAIVPQQPTSCPREIYDLMKECWNKDATVRPTFREIHMFLQRKNLGYNPKDEKLQTSDFQATFSSNTTDLGIRQHSGTAVV